MNEYGIKRAQTAEIEGKSSNISLLRFSVAPMMEWTDRHCRFFHRLLTRRALLYTEMVTAAAVLRGDRARLLGYDPAEHPVAVQLGGSDPPALAEAARICADFGYDEINLNVGCPSDRVQEGRFGACLMTEPAVVGDCVAAMKASVRIPVTVKCRIGVDDQDPEESLDAMADAVVAARGDAPPLDYDRVYRLKRRHPALAVVLNGGLDSLETASKQLEHVDGVMMGRAAYREPWRLLNVDPVLFGEPPPAISLRAAAEALIPYIERKIAVGVRLYAIARHVLGLFHGVPGARAFRRHLAEEGVKPDAGGDTFRAALAKLVDDGRDMGDMAA